MLPSRRIRSTSEDYSSARARYPQLDDALRTREGFVTSVDARSDAYPFLIVIFFVGVAAMIAALWLALPYKPARLTWWQALLWFGPHGVGPDPTQIVITWLGLALIVVGGVWAIARQVGRHGAANRLFDRYQRGGFLARLTATGIPVRRGRATVPLFAFASPDVPDDVAVAAIERLRASASDSLAYVIRLGRLTRSFLARGRALSRMDDAMPDGVFVTSRPRVWSGGQLRVAVPVASDPTTVALFRLNRDVSDI